MDFKSVSVKGAFNYARARVLWRGGLLRVYTVEGLQVDVMSERPVRRPRFLGTWDVKAYSGNITLRAKCVTCGGRKWWRVVSKSFDELWSTT